MFGLKFSKPSREPGSGSQLAVNTPTLRPTRPKREKQAGARQREPWSDIGDTTGDNEITANKNSHPSEGRAVSYTHLTLPTICSV